jgi:hypothetical protein
MRFVGICKRFWHIDFQGDPITSFPLPPSWWGIQVHRSSYAENNLGRSPLAAPAHRKSQFLVFVLFPASIPVMFPAPSLFVPYYELAPLQRKNSKCQRNRGFECLGGSKGAHFPLFPVMISYYLWLTFQHKNSSFTTHLVRHRITQTYLIRS